jgi:hypothetical protein
MPEVNMAQATPSILNVVILGVCPRNNSVSKQVGRRAEMILPANEFRKPGPPALDT